MNLPLPNFHFIVEWADLRIGLTKVRNLMVSTEQIEFREGRSPDYGSQQAPGRPSYQNFFFERPVVRGNNEFFDWWKATSKFTEGGSPGSIFRQDITISLLNEEHDPVVTWKARNAFPVSLSWTELNSTGNEMVTEILEITCEEIELKHN